MRTRVSVALETTPKRTFASAVDWPGWSRSGRTLETALEALLSHADRYVLVASRAGESLPTDDLELAVDETGPGNATTEFGVPGRVSEADRRPTSAAEADRLVRLVAAAWAWLDETAASAPGELRRGPRGGGRDTSKILEHTLLADHAYAREMGLRLPPPAPDDREAAARLRAAMLDLLYRPSDGSPLDGRRWPARYAAHRIAWHALDHAWEIQDRSTG
jgi:hypothetical protein